MRELNRMLSSLLFAEERTLGSDQTTLRDLSDSLMPKMPKAGDFVPI